MGACAQIAVFTYAVMRRTPRYEIRLAAPFADNLMNSVAHCGELPINVERLLRHIYFIDGMTRNVATLENKKDLAWALAHKSQSYSIHGA